MSRKIILIKQELLLLVYELNRSGLLAENEKIRKQAVVRSEERFSRNAETDLVCRLLLEKKKEDPGCLGPRRETQEDAGQPTIGGGHPHRAVERQRHPLRSADPRAHKGNPEQPADAPVEDLHVQGILRESDSLYYGIARRHDDFRLGRIGMGQAGADDFESRRVFVRQQI